MKKITKLFVVILSAASFTLSAFAGELSVTGSANASYKMGGADSANGKGIGVSNELDFNASGEIDGGYTWKWQTQLDGASAVNDDTRLEISGSTGTVGFYISENDISSKLGYGIGAMGVGSDFTGPTTVEWGTTMNNYNNIGYATPAGLLPAGGSLKIAYSPNLNASSGASYKAAGTTETKVVGSDATAVRVDFVPMDGLKVGADYMVAKGGADVARRQQSAGVYVKYATGPLTLGMARTGYQPIAQNGFTSGTLTYDTLMYGAQFAVNDALSVSYSEEKADRDTSAVIAPGGGTTAGVTVAMKVKHLQAAYTVGGATLGLAIADASNSDYTVNKDERTTTFTIGMAF